MLLLPTLVEEIEEYAGTKLSEQEAKSITLASRGFRISDFKKRWEQNKDQLEGLKTLDPEKAAQARRQILDRFSAIVRSCSDDDLLHTTAAEVEANQRGVLTDAQREKGLAYVARLKRVEVQDRSRDIAGDITFAIEDIFAKKSVVKEYELWEQILLHAQGKNVDLARMKAEVREMLLWVEEGEGSINSSERSKQATQRVAAPGGERTPRIPGSIRNALWHSWGGKDLRPCGSDSAISSGGS